MQQPRTGRAPRVSAHHALVESGGAGVGRVVGQAERVGLVLDRGQLGQLGLVVGESSVILLHPPLPLVGVSIVMMRECQQNDSLADG